MKIIRIIGKSFKDAFKSVFRNFSLSMSAISCTAITLILVAIALLTSYNVNSITDNIEDVLNIVVFVDSNATKEQTDKLTYDINSLSNIDDKKTEYTSKEELKEELSEDENMKEILNSLDENPLQATIVVSVKDAREIDETAKKIKNFEHVTSVKYGETVVNKIVSMFDVLKDTCFVAVIALIAVTAFLINNTIKITIFSRRNEINIMRLVGTSNAVIKLPFFIEGFILGLFGSIIPVLLTVFGYQFIYDFIGGKLFIDLMVLVKPTAIVYNTSLIIIIVGVIVGVFSSTNAVRKYLKV